LIKQAVTARFLVILVLVGVVHVAIGGALWSLTRGGGGDEPAGGDDNPPANQQQYQVTPPDSGGGTAPPPVAPPANPGYVVHKVSPGESYWGIASRYKTTVGELQRINGHAPNHTLQPGDTLKVPKK
jgi:LysM repeat protein